MRSFQIMALASILAAMTAGKKRTSRIKTRDTPATSKLRALIRAEAIAQGVPVEIALATARVESQFDPNAEGDKNWHLNVARFNREVPKSHPQHGQPELWHSYGLFQLLAPYFVRANEDPRALLDPQINAKRGVKRLKELLNTHHGDPDLVRLHYTNADEADATYQNKVLSIWHKALQTEREAPKRGMS